MDDAVSPKASEMLGRITASMDRIIIVASSLDRNKDSAGVLDPIVEHMGEAQRDSLIDC